MNARVEAACAALYDTWGDDERLEMRCVLLAADEAEASITQRLAECLRSAVATMRASDPTYAPHVQERSMSALAEFDALRSIDEGAGK